MIFSTCAINQLESDGTVPLIIYGFHFPDGAHCYMSGATVVVQQKVHERVKFLWFPLAVC
jgi:hypothetical protein